MKIKELLSTPDKWTRKVSARDKDGNETYPTDKDAHSFCLMGAVMKCYEGDPDKRHEIWTAILNKVNVAPTYYNDNSSYERVMEVVNELNI